MDARSALRRLAWPRALKTKLMVVLLSSTVIPLALVGSISYYAIYDLLDQRIEEGIESSLRQTKLTLENSLNQLRYVSQQLSLDGSVGQNLQLYLTTAARLRLVYQRWWDITGSRLAIPEAVYAGASPRLRKMFRFETLPR